ncbi:MAG: hypothetical protein Q4A17_12165 [Thermoguttaceae bacterium]|nr:hypothetical protein [Thermoguttaceae bacterium]
MSKSVYRYVSGKRYRLTEDGKLIFSPDKNSGFHGVKKVTMRVPETLVPFITQVLEKLEEIEECRRNIAGNIFNTSSEFILPKEKE